MSLLRRLGFVPVHSPREEVDLLGAIEARLANVEPRRAELVAAFGGLLAQVAHVDGEISGAEVARMEDLLAAHGGLAVEEARIVATIARQETLRGTESYLLTRRFNEIGSDVDKLRLIDCLYAVASADDLVAYVEDVEVRKIAEALLVPWSEVLKIRAPYREKLEELRRLADVRERKA
ncbi:MAG: hypothetical protein QOD06_772 [Candidatus Binatota bacterium]|nr:hypothetical protein [Candidatus Binatota bacterium]